MMNKDGEIIKEKIIDDLSIIEYGKIPWNIFDDQIVLADGKGNFASPTLDLKFFNRYNLDSISTYTYQIKDSIDFNFASGVVELKDHYVVSGWYRITNTDTWPDFLVWIDKSNMEIDTMIEYPFEKESVIPEFLFVGQDRLLTYYFSGLRLGDANNSRGFVKLDSNKNIVFHYLDKIDLSTNHQYEHSGLLMKNGKMLYKQRYNGSEQPWPGTWMSDFDILCIDDNGQIVWRFNKPGGSYTGGYLQFKGTKNVLHMTETADGDILACGTTNWHFNYPTIFEYNWTTDTLPPFPDSLETYEAPYILKLDGETGELIWQYAIIEYDEYENITPYALRQVHELSDGSIMGTGWSKVTNENGFFVKNNSWAVRLPAEGCISDDGMECGYEYYLPTSINEPILIDMTTDRPFIFYPNPSDGHFLIRDTRKNKTKVTYEIFNIKGEQVHRKENVRLSEIDITDQTSGIYLCKVYDNNGKVIQVERLVKN
ncbi:MAG: hypothetical protein ACJATI_004479 [Halioglobus sp.]|jgi:hypothetical protein